jgi:hypothetical protein
MDVPMAWIGHTADVFWNPRMLQHMLAGVQYALGDLKADERNFGARRGVE